MCFDGGKYTMDQCSVGGLMVKRTIFPIVEMT